MNKDGLYLSLDPDFQQTLKTYAGQYQDEQRKADLTKWRLAKEVNDWYSEHAAQFDGDKLSYYKECSRVANENLYIPILGESGQTLRRWCEVEATYENFDVAVNFLETLSFDHMAKAKKLAKDGKVSVPTLALAEALSRHWSVDDMMEHYDPPSVPHPYDVYTGHMAFMLERKNWDWIKSAEVKNKILSNLVEVEELVNAELEKEGKANG